MYITNNQFKIIIILAFIDTVLKQPSYGWQDQRGNLIVPGSKQLLAEFFLRINIFKSRKNWLSLLGWVWLVMLVPFLFLFITEFFSWWLFAAGFVYSMIVMGTHGTIWYHRYCTHRAFTFKNRFWKFITRNLTIKLVPEETYVVSHHVHHAKSDQPGDPYNTYAGWMYCFLADVNHQPIAKDLDRNDYARVVSLLEHSGMKCNTYEQYQQWGSVAHPLPTVLHWLLNWSVWYLIFFLIGGNALACTFFAGALIWGIGVRTFNYEGHGKGKNRHHEGVDFNHADMSINQYWPGFVAGEWHNNHHLYPASARAGFLPYQVDFAWYYIRFLYLIGAVTTYHNSVKQFYEKHYEPYVKNKTSAREVA